MRVGSKRFFESSENENQVADQGVPSPENALCCYSIGCMMKNRLDGVFS
ncbi:UNVERIFIED_ORG: hypothetical protein J2X79_000052 [Arthrobacter globiformis]|nr:hypothetical protein [Arthrobacter globiformis]